MLFFHFHGASARAGRRFRSSGRAASSPVSADEKEKPLCDDRDSALACVPHATYKRPAISISLSLTLKNRHSAEVSADRTSG